MSFVINTSLCLLSLDCINTLIMMKSVTENVVADILGQKHLHAIIEQVEEMLRMSRYLLVVIKALLKFTLVGLRHDKYVY